MDAETKGVDGIIGLDPLASTKHIYVIHLLIDQERMHQMFHQN
jgi:hypothetical protein